MKNKQEQFAFLEEEGIFYVVVGTKSRKRAGELIRKYEREECGMNEKDGDMFNKEMESGLEYKKMAAIKDEFGNQSFWWGDKNKTSCETCLRPLVRDIDGFIFRV